MFKIITILTITAIFLLLSFQAFWLLVVNLSYLSYSQEAVYFKEFTLIKVKLGCHQTSKIEIWGKKLRTKLFLVLHKQLNKTINVVTSRSVSVTSKSKLKCKRSTISKQEHQETTLIINIHWRCFNNHI